MSCPTDELAGLVDGELDHAARERVLAHLAHCARCRTEVDAQRGLKLRLQVTPPPVPPAELVARLQGLVVPGTDVRHVPGGPVRPAALRPAGRAAAATAPARRRSTRRLDRRAVGALAVLGLGTALALGGPRPTGPTAPVDPTSPTFVVDHVSTTNPVQPAVPVGAAVVPVGR